MRARHPQPTRRGRRASRRRPPSRARSLFGIEEVGIQTEEPFSILPLEAFCNGAIAACSDEMLKAEADGDFELVPALAA